MKIAVMAAAISIAGTGLTFAADMPPPPPVAPVMTWTGFYVGLNAGGAWDNNHSVDTLGRTVPGGGLAAAVGPGSFAANSAAAATGSSFFGNNGRFIGGGQIGYNWQFGYWVAGFEADIDGLAKQNRTSTLNQTVGPFPFAGANEVINSQITTTRTLDYLGTARVRLGVLATPSFLLYGTGGAAYGRARANTSISQTNNDCVFFPGNCLTPNAASFGSVSTTLFGWTAGVGGEWMFAPNWSAKVEYLYYDLGNLSGTSTLTTPGGTLAPGSVAIVPVSTTAKFNGSIARVGINYRFGGPVVSQY